MTMAETISRSQMEAEKPELTLGFIPLSDCAPLIIAVEQGFFASEGLGVTLSREPSWANIRDKVCLGLLDGAQMLAGMPIASSLNAEGLNRPMLTAFSLSLNGNAITVSNRLYQRLLELDPEAMSAQPITARALARLIRQDQTDGAPPLRFAMVYPYSSHHYLLRYWLSAEGIDPDRDLQLIVVPPPRMVDYLRGGMIDGYCVGEPWNTRAIEDDIGQALVASYDIWNNHPEKVFGVTVEWAERYPQTHLMVLRALLRAAQWVDQPENRLETIDILARSEYLNESIEVLKAGLLGQFRYRTREEPRPMPDFHVFQRYCANYPWLSHAEWIMTQMIRWKQVKPTIDIHKMASSIYRPELYRQAAGSLGLPCPPMERKQEGVHAMPWLLTSPRETFPMGPDCFIDRHTFDPSDPMNYLNNISLPKGNHFRDLH